MARGEEGSVEWVMSLDSTQLPVPVRALLSEIACRWIKNLMPKVPNRAVGALPRLAEYVATLSFHPEQSSEELRSRGHWDFSAWIEKVERQGLSFAETEALCRHATAIFKDPKHSARAFGDPAIFPSGDGGWTGDSPVASGEIEQLARSSGDSVLKFHAAQRARMQEMAAYRAAAPERLAKAQQDHQRWLEEQAQAAAVQLAALEGAGVW